jgi:hypothetical protein
MAGEGRSTSWSGGSDRCDRAGGVTALWVLMDRGMPEALLDGDGGRLGIPDDAVGSEITPISDPARVDSHRWRLWAEVNRRPFLTIGGRRMHPTGTNVRVGAAEENGSPAMAST